jgi:predicted nucleotidyltransferase
VIIDPRLTKQVEQHPYPLIFVTISGAHLYGFPSPDSDYDLRGVHVLPVQDVVGLKTGPETIEQSLQVAGQEPGAPDGSRRQDAALDPAHENPDGLEIDLVTHDVRKFFGLVLKKNGYVLEQLFSPLIVHSTPPHDELKDIARVCITRHHAHHYLGFADTQWRLFQKEDPPHIKPLLYVYRVLLTGIHLMRTGEVEANLLRLNETARLSYIPELVARKVGGCEKGRLDQADLAFHQQEYARLLEKLEEASAQSQLPEAPRGAPALHDLLVRLRLGDKGAGATRPGPGP